LAKSGDSGGSNARHEIVIRSDWRDYDLASNAAHETGLLKSGPGDVYSLRNEDALAFARKLDSIIVAGEI
jgi:hypothetical protein